MSCRGPRVILLFVVSEEEVVLHVGVLIIIKGIEPRVLLRGIDGESGPPWMLS